jgi:hypothetical protein
MPTRDVEETVLEVFAAESTTARDAELVAVQIEPDGPLWTVEDGAVVAL